MDALEQYFDSFDIMSIPLETRKKWYKSYEEADILFNDLYMSTPEENPFDFELNSFSQKEQTKKYIGESKLHDDLDKEGLFMTLSCRDAIEELIEKYEIDENQFVILKLNHDEICKIKNLPITYRGNSFAIIPDIGLNISIVDRTMKRYGYARVHTRKYKDSLGWWATVLYNPINPTDITTFIKKCNYKLLHYTPAFNHESIMKNGLLPSKDKIFDFKQKRLYLYVFDMKTPLTDSFKRILRNMSANLKRQDRNFDCKFIKYVVDTNKLPENIKFQVDPNLEECAFTTSPIAVDYISDFEETYIYPPSN